jgi:hypothetical protein
VEAGKVTHLDVELPEPPTDVPAIKRGIEEQIVLADGRTPALGALVARYIPAERQPWGAGMADANGTIRPRWFGIPAPRDGNEPGVPRESLVIAWLPGQTGAAIAPLPASADKPLAITLPPAVPVRGTVRIAGDGSLIENGAVRVRAQYADFGKLNDLLSRETSVQSDGSFELAGLTPGRVQVQAALDGVWLSPTVEVDVRDAELPPLSLTIPAPGGPVLVRLIGSRGEAGPEKLFVTRPTGPLTERLWPAHFTPDGAEVIRIPALEAGEHTIRVGETSQVVTVLPLTHSGDRPLEVSLDLSGAKR